MPADNTFEYNSKAYKAFLRRFRNEASSAPMLIVFAGAFTTHRLAALDELKREVIGQPTEIDLNTVITPYEDESYANIDSALAKLDENLPLLIFKNAEQLSGAYTGFTSSAVKYASPQQKYFLRKISAIKAPVVLDFKEADEPDRMVLRKADAVVFFEPPSSLIERMAWKLKNVHVHGSRFFSPRPQ